MCIYYGYSKTASQRRFVDAIERKTESDSKRHCSKNVASYGPQTGGTLPTNTSSGSISHSSPFSGVSWRS
jgi:hypothetical protein